MSILAYVGLPGSGKSYDVVANQIVPALKSKRRVCTNIPLNMDKVRELIPDAEVIEFPTELIQSNPDQVFDYAQNGTVLILDEVWRLFPAGLKANHVPESFRKLLAEHRHMVDESGNSMQIVLVTQDLAQISAFARQLIEQTVYHTKLTSIGADNRYRIDIYQGAVSGHNPNKSMRLREIYGKYEDKITALYVSHTMSKSATGAVNEKTADGRGNILKRPMLIAGLLIIPLIFIFGIPVVKKGLQPKVAEQENPSDNPIQTVQAGLNPSQKPLITVLSCSKVKYDIFTTCTCIDSTGEVALEGQDCITHFDKKIANFDPDAKQKNIDYLNAKYSSNNPTDSKT